MNTSDVMRLAIGAAIGLFSIPLLALLLRAVTIQVEDGEAVLVTTFGKLSAMYKKPGLCFLPAKVMPWVSTTKVSLRRDFRCFEGVHVNDARGTTVIVDLWVEYRVADPTKAIFSVADWNRSLQNLVAHAATSILGNRDFRQILCDRTELGTLLAEDISLETARWGIAIELVFIRNVSLLPEVSRQIFEAIAARLERAKAHVEEDGRLRVARLEADTGLRVAELVADAKGQYPAAVGRALAKMKTNPAVLKAYDELYRLSLLRPHRTVTFRGFESGEVRAADAAMILPHGNGSSGHASAALPARADGRIGRS